jgi:hypothetical protein
LVERQASPGNIEAAAGETAFDVLSIPGLHADPPALPHIRFKPGFDKRNAFRS